MLKFKDEVVKFISQIDSGLEYEEIESLIEIPPSHEMGDYAFPCYRLAKTFRKAPNLIANDLVEKIGENKYFERVESAGPYVNFFLKKETLVKTVLDEAKEKKDRFGSSNMGEGKTVLVEFSSPNIAKPFHIGHIRTTIIGHSLYRIFGFLGYDTVAINHLGDYGTQFGKLIVGYKNWGDRETIEADPINELLKIYVRFHEEVEKNPSLDEEARHWFNKLEHEDEEALELWHWMREISLSEFNKVYKMLGIKFDSLAGESFYSDKMPRVIEIGRAHV